MSSNWLCNISEIGLGHKIKQQPPYKGMPLSLYFSVLTMKNQQLNYSRPTEEENHQIQHARTPVPEVILCGDKISK